MTPAELLVDMIEKLPIDREVFAAEFERLSERDAIQEIESELSAAPYIDFAAKFLATEDPPVQYLINELLPAEVIALMHGEPRTRKSWAALEIAIALATGTPAFGLPRFQVSKPARVLYSSQEDGSRPVRERTKRSLAGRGVRVPENLAFSVHKGINLDSPEWQESLLQDVKRYGFRLVIFDPIRRYSDNVDKGPSEVQRITGFLRSLVRETGASVLINHHDTKPSANGPDTRRRSQKASGGDWFAASDCPIAVEPAGENCSLVVPEDYKFTVDPKPFTFRLEEDASKAWVRIAGEDSNVEQATEIATQEKIIGYLTEHAGASGSGIAKGIRIRKDEVLAALEHLLLIGKVDSIKADRKGKATTWFIREEIRK